MSLRYALLQVLQASPMNGYRLARFFAGAQSWVWSAPQSQVYGALGKLREAGLVAGTPRPGENGLSTADYALTPAGEADLLAWLSTAHPEPPVRDAVALQALGFDTVPTGRAVAVLRAHIAEQEARLAEWTEHRAALLRRDTPLLRERLKGQPPAAHRRIAEVKAMVFEREIDLARAQISWAHRMIALLEGLEPAPAGAPGDAGAAVASTAPPERLA
ncbi:helix-turn-helix transcriptional regulator [Georgenia ruanii]|uniref:PadR family transcriptional regulator n=1 Tax=Georgenia ruanii TaxID=348442 RepID=A0A7J9V0R6_9MICO|nr:helix-turn-helix transcriptional regulator [Georgenia ruanii]MPV90203.1 PadR family transcriptional regulator [Georgenia ruanii]